MPRKKSGKERHKEKNYYLDKVNTLPTGSFLDSPFTALKSKLLLLIMLIGLTLLLLVGPFYRGLFFTQDLLVAQAVIFGLFIVWGIFRIVTREKILVKSPLDLCLILLLFAYILSYFTAVHYRAALEEILKIASYLVIYLVTIAVCHNLYLGKRNNKVNNNDEKRAEQLPPGLGVMLNVLIAAATTITIASLGVAAGHWDFIGAYHDAGLRIASPMGYSNTAAAYLMAAYLLTVALAPLAQRWWQKALYLVPAALIFMTTILTFSRGAWLLLVPLMILLVLAAAPGQRLRSFLYLIASAVPALPAAFLADPIFRSPNPAQAWFAITAAIVCALILGFAVELFLRQDRKIKLFAGGVTVLALTVALVWFAVIPLLSPLTLQHQRDSTRAGSYVEQVIENVKASEEYQIAFEVKASQGGSGEQRWIVEVLGGLPGYRSEELFSQQGQATDAWVAHSIIFLTRDDTARLEVRLSLPDPGTSINLRSVKLISAGDQKALSFIPNRILPQRYYDRIFSHGRDRNLYSRLRMFGDAAKIIRDSPILGAGGGGWNALYQGYQEKPLQGRPYFSSEVHNHFLQVWIEAGLLGFIAFVGIWVSMAAAFIRNCFINRAENKRWQYWTAVFLPVAALGAHSVIDWNFSMAAVGIFLFTLLGAGNSLDKVTWFKGKSQSKRVSVKFGVGSIILLVVAIILFSWNLVLIGGFNSTARSQEYIERGNIKGAVPELQRAIRLDPLRAENYHNLGVLLEEQTRGTQSVENLETIIFLAGHAQRLEPYNPLYIFRYGELLLNYVDVRSGLETIDRLLIVRPLNDSSYIQISLARLRLAEYYFSAGSPSEGIRYLNEIEEIKIKMQDRYGETEPLNYILGRVELLKGNSASAREFFNAVREGDPFYDLAQQQLQLLDE